VTSLGTSMMCSCKNCLYDDIARTCTVSNLLNAARQKTCNVPTTTAGTQPGVGLTPPTTTTAAASGTTTVGSPCTPPDYPDTTPTGCVNCTVATYCINNEVTTKPCPNPSYNCYPNEGSLNYCVGPGVSPIAC
jgi:hypothetical protein